MNARVHIIRCDPPGKGLRSIPRYAWWIAAAIVAAAVLMSVLK